MIRGLCYRLRRGRYGFWKDNVYRKAVDEVLLLVVIFGGGDGAEGQQIF